MMLLDQVMFDSLGWRPVVQTLILVSGGAQDPHLCPGLGGHSGGLQCCHGLHVAACPAPALLRPPHQPSLPHAPQHPRVQPRILPPGQHGSQCYCSRCQWNEDLAVHEGWSRSHPRHYVHHCGVRGQYRSATVLTGDLPCLGSSLQLLRHLGQSSVFILAVYYSSIYKNIVTFQL